MFTFSRKVSAMETHLRAAHRNLVSLALPVLALCSLATTAHAQVTGVPIFFTNYYQQTDSVTTVYNGSNFDARLFETNTADVVSATLTYPGPASPGTYAATTYSNTTLDYGMNELSTAALQTGFPFGTYTVDYSGGTAGTGSASASYTQNAFSSTIPTLTPTTFTGLQGLDTSQPFTIAFNTDMPIPASTENDVFVNIFDAGTGTIAIGQGFLPSTTTSFFVPANTLAPNTSYNVHVIFSDRISTTSSGVDTTLGFDQDTSAAFTTAAVPETSTTVSLGLLLALGLGGVVVAARCKKQSV
jgi:hypothetical protein